MLSRLIEPKQSIPERRRCTLRHIINIDDGPSVVTLSIVSKGKKLLEKEQVLDSKNEEPHHHTRLKIRVTAPHNYKRLPRHSDDSDSDHLAIASLWSYASSQQKRAMPHMLNRSDDIDHRMEAQKCLIQEQQKTIDELKELLMKVVENTQKTTDDKAEGSFLVGPDRKKKRETNWRQ